MKEWLRVYTYKAGLLSPMAHDLQISLSRWNLQPEGSHWLFQADAAHLEIDGPIVRGQLEQRGITDKDRRKIKNHIQDTILKTQSHPKIIFRGRPKNHTLEGELRLKGRIQPITIPLRNDGSLVRGEVEIQPSRWGITPFKALGGAIKLQDRIRVAFCVNGL